MSDGSRLCKAGPSAESIAQQLQFVAVAFRLLLEPANVGQGGVDTVPGRLRLGLLHLVPQRPHLVERRVVVLAEPGRPSVSDQDVERVDEPTQLTAVAANVFGDSPLQVGVAGTIDIDVEKTELAFRIDQ